MLDTPLMLVELSVMEQRYQAVSLVVHDGESVVEVARRGHLRMLASVDDPRDGDEGVVAESTGEPGPDDHLFVDFDD